MSQKTSHPKFIKDRHAGVLLHPTSLPGNQLPGCERNGDIGPQAYHFLDFLQSCGISIWQMLPLGPTHDGGSPYMSLSVLAGNSDLISLQLLLDWGWLQKKDLNPKDKLTSLRTAGKLFAQRDNAPEQREYSEFLTRHENWLPDFALFQAIHDHQQGRSWLDWPAALRDKEPQAVAEAKTQLQSDIDQIYFEQFVFFKQWAALKSYANQRGILIFGDMPIFVATDSAEVWAHREYFDLGPDGKPKTVAGVPPDYFSATGQLWGNPHYNWQRMRKDDFLWWRNRISGTLELFDLIRIDHFRGFEAYWQIDADAKTAIHGKWVKAPGEALFKTLSKTFGELPFVAEDLGTITPEVNALREKFGWPGMKILQFAFDGDVSNPYLPHNHVPNSVVYTGTHDNDTTLGWFESLSNHDRDGIYEYLGRVQEPMPWALIRCALASTANLAVIPMQDILSLGEGQRMNTPGQRDGNWSWRFEWSDVHSEVAGRLRHLVSMYGREIHK
jgi:4-alpha-glucanotransferase